VKAGFWLAAQGSGTLASPYSFDKNSLIVFPSSASSDLPVTETIRYTYDWEGNMVGDVSKTNMNNGELCWSHPTRDASSNGAVIGLDSLATMNINLTEGKKIIKDVNVYYYSRVQQPYNYQPPSFIQIYCSEDGSAFFPVSFKSNEGGYCNEDYFPKGTAKNEGINGACGRGKPYFYNMSVDVNHMCNQLKVSVKNSFSGAGAQPLILSEVVINGWPIDKLAEVGYGSFEYNVPRLPWRDMTKLDSPTGSPAEAWSQTKYFAGGWYPVQASFKSGGPSSYPPAKIQLRWRKYNDSGAQEWEKEYISGEGGARISPCEPGAAADCSCDPRLDITMVSGETKSNQTIATLTDYGTPVKVRSSDGGALVFVNDLGEEKEEIEVPPDSYGKVIVTLRSKPVESLTTVNLSIEAPAADGSGSACNCLASVIIRPGIYWQVKDMDVTTLGSIKSFLPTADAVFDLKGSDSPGIPVFGGSLSLGSGKASEPNWQANTRVTNYGSTYNYSYFYNHTPSEIRNKWDDTNNVLSGGFTQSLPNLVDFAQEKETVANDYLWVKVGGDLNLSKSTLPSGKKLVVFVEGNFNITGNITLYEANSFLMFVVKGNINLSSPSSVTQIEGLFFTQKDFDTGTVGSRQDSQLKVTGSVIALGKVYLRRSLPSTQAESTPAEYFTYSPALFLQIPPTFNQRIFNWSEINP